MTWEKPEFVEIDMNAEIGAYQSDFEPDPGRERAPEPD
jgi:coenzyme PQQ precursor peptide PqqA